MRTIYKYYIKPDVVMQSFNSFEGAKILSAGIDPNDNMCVWVEVNTSNPPLTISFFCVGTGWNLDEIMKDISVEYVGTLSEYPYVWHVYACA